jgi:hypothetical protein
VLCSPAFSKYNVVFLTEVKVLPALNNTLTLFKSVLQFKVIGRLSVSVSPVFFSALFRRYRSLKI